MNVWCNVSWKSFNMVLGKRYILLVIHHIIKIFNMTLFLLFLFLLIFPLSEPHSSFRLILYIPDTIVFGVLVLMYGLIQYRLSGTQSSTTNVICRKMSMYLVLHPLSLPPPSPSSPPPPLRERRNRKREYQRNSEWEF